MEALSARVVVVLVRPRSPGNVGAAARAVANSGLEGLVLVDPPAFDPDEARWMAPNAHAIIDGARFCGNLAEAVQDRQWVVGTTARERRFGWPVHNPASLCAELRADPKPTAIVFGPEDSGLSNPDLELCDALLRLPTAAHASLNLAHAVSVVGAWLRGLPEHLPEGPPPPPPPPAAGLRRKLVEDAVAVLHNTSYFEGHSPEQAAGTLQRLLGALRADPSEVAAMGAMLKSLKYGRKTP
jgi:TrmH family RNA methyltransferase